MNTRISDKVPSIIGITEVKAKIRSMKKMKDSELSIDEVGKYDMFCTNIANEDGRVCIFYVSQELQAVQVHFDTKFDTNVFSNINLPNGDKFVLGVIYRSPNSGDNNNSLQPRSIRVQPEKKCRKLKISRKVTWMPIKQTG